MCIPGGDGWRYMKQFRLHDWNDIRLLLACADKGGFAGAAMALGIDQTTVSRRLSQIEEGIGRPLFTRRRSGATPTVAGLALIERARAIQASVADFEGMLGGLSNFPPPAVVIGASEGLLSYTLIPVLLGSSATSQPIDLKGLKHPLPHLTFTTSLAQADIAIVATSAGDVPAGHGAIRVRRVGSMNFKAAAARAYLHSAPGISRFDDLAAHPLIDVSIYRAINSLESWNGLIAGKTDGATSVTTTTPQMHQALLDVKGVSILPSYSELYDDRIVLLDIPAPHLSVSLWLVAHEDKLREPAIRELYDALAETFLTSPWFRQR